MKEKGINHLTQQREGMGERIIQFGEGNFLRGFVDWMVDHANKQGDFAGSIVIVQPLPDGQASLINEQFGLYTVLLRGLVDGERVVQTDVIGSVSRALSAYDEWEQVLQCAADPQIDIMVSNTTEAGIAYQAGDRLDDSPPASFPAKVTAYLYRRYQAFAGDPKRGMLVIPCELIADNGRRLEEIVVRLAREWQLPDEFIAWVQDHTIFANTLVDRIVTGLPEGEERTQVSRQLGYDDPLLTTAEPYHLLVLEGPAAARERFPLDKTGLNVCWVDDLTPYQMRKVRVLNGIHTSSFALALLADFAIVREALEDREMAAFVETMVRQEILPAIPMDQQELQSYAEQVMERFRNPFITHRWRAIALNAVAKYRTRVLPSLLYHLEQGELPRLLSLSLAALLHLYYSRLHAGPEAEETFPVNEEASIWTICERIYADADTRADFVDRALAAEELWGCDLTQWESLVRQIKADTQFLQTDGARAVLQALAAEGITAAENEAPNGDKEAQVYAGMAD